MLKCRCAIGEFLNGSVEIGVELGKAESTLGGGFPP